MFPAAWTAALMNDLTSGRSETVIVGIGYPTEDIGVQMRVRNRDLTPTPAAPEASAAPGGSAFADAGGAEAFYRFIVDELRPAIARHVAIDPAKQGLYGHSLGGLFTLGVLFRHPDAFGSYLISSPSIWWNKRVVLADEAAFAARVARGEIAPRVLVMVGGDEQSVPATLPPGVTAAAVQASFAQTRMVDNARDLARRLSAIPGKPGYVVQSRVFEGESHLSVVSASLGRGIAFAFPN